MIRIFVTLLTMSIGAAWLILIVLFLRLLLRQAPKWVNCVLWGFAALRLVCPYVPESRFSLMPGVFRMQNRYGSAADLTLAQTPVIVWTEKYEQENAYTETTIAVITFPEEYDGQELVYCIADAQFYYPERSLTDEELLQLIDLEHKNLYIYERIQREIERGERAGWPETYDIQR